MFTLLTGLSLAVGLMIPTIFEWGQEQMAGSRHPELEFVAFLSVFVSLVIATAFWFVNKPAKNRANGDEFTSAVHFQFGIRHVLLATTIVAIIIAITQLFEIPNSVLQWFMVGLLVAVATWTVFQPGLIRSRSGTVLSSMFMPFAWIIPTNVPFGHTSGLLPAILFGPGLLPAVFIGRGSIDRSVIIAVVFVILELGVGIWLARRGGRLALTYILFLFFLSSITSFGFHGLYRM